MTSEKLLVTNADDFGYTRDVNDGIVEAHRNGILTATTLMANGREFDHAVQLAKRYPTLDIGCHLVLVGGESLLPPHKPYPRDLKAVIKAVLSHQINVEAELDAQIRKIAATGITLTHLDTHKHTHLLPNVLRAVGKLSEKYRIPWIRRPFDYPMHAGSVPYKRRLLSRALGWMRGSFHRVLSAHGCRTTDHFAGFDVTGHFHTAELISLLRQLPTGSTEFMTHPGFCTDELRASPTRLKESRLRELEALTAPETKAAIRSLNIRLVTYRDLSLRAR